MANEVQIGTPKRMKLLNLKQWVAAELEQLRSDMSEVLGVSGVAYDCIEVKNTPTNEWVKMFKLRPYELPTGF